MSDTQDTTATTAVATLPTEMEAVDHLQWEVFDLRADKAARIASDAQAELSRIQDARGAFQAAMIEKYRLDPSKDRVGPDRKISRG